MTATEPSTTFQRQDTSVCPHLDALLASRSSDGIHVKEEQSDPSEGLAQGSTVAHPLKGSHGHLNDLEKRFVQSIRWGSIDQGVKRRKVAAPRCHSCDTTLSRPWACLTCPFIGCMSIHASSSTSKDCMRDHWQAEDNSCGFGTIYCAECDDCIYPDSFDALYRQARVEQEQIHDKSREPSMTGKGRPRGAYQPWNPSEAVTTLDSTKVSCRGLRPLLNLSQTCFLSAILQALIHNPLLKAYFLSDKHNRHVCANNSKGLAVGKPFLGHDGTVSADREKGCMCCEMDRAFEEFHNDDKSAFGPVTMLYSMWHASAELEGYGQQDAHSFFLASLDQIHAHAKGQLSSCNCIAHQTFAGSLLSAVTCSNCRTTSTTVDPILDIQLDFPTDVQDADSLSLNSMLRRFCAEEKVGDHSKGYACSSCGGGSGTVALRKLLLKKLPPVLSFQLKRFAHNATSTKVELPVRFPSHLNMRPYVEAQPDSSAPLPLSLYEYDLFAVVTHEGKLDNGHYWADVLCGDEWWHCDDDKVTPTTLKNVLAQKAYMLFYVKRSLAYVQSNKPAPTALTNGTAAPTSVST